MIYRCRKCGQLKEGIKLKSYNLKLCFNCFIDFFLKRVETTISKFKMFTKKQKLLVAVSGGKDSLALAKALKELEYNLTLFHLNTNIKENDYAEKSLEKVKNFAEKEKLPLIIRDLEKEIGAPLKTAAKVFKKEICGVCGFIRRYIMNREAKNFDVILTGHTLNDEVGSLLASFLYWKEGFIRRQAPILKEEDSLKRKAKPLALISEFETLSFCKIVKIDFLEMRCPYRGGTYLFFKKIVDEIETNIPTTLLGFYKGFLKRKKFFSKLGKKEKLAPCIRCGYLTSAGICNFCRLKEKLKELK